MASITTDYIWTWKSLEDEGSTLYTIFWRDFNPRQTDIPDTTPTTEASWETSFNLSWFQVGSEVCFCMLRVSVEWLKNVTISYTMRFQKYKNWWQNAWWVDSYTDSYNSDDYWHHPRWYVWIDSDEIRTDATRYRFLISASWWWVSWSDSAEFTISSLSFDTSSHPAWYMRVEWTQLCFTDALISSTRWYAHRITPDSSYSASYVGSDKAWYIWIPSTSSNHHIYYIDKNGYERRTNETQTRFSSSDAYAWTSKAWYIWVSNGNMNKGYWHLCYVSKEWYKRRITNWNFTS